MSMPTDVPIQTIHVIEVVTPEFAKKLKDYSVRLGALESGYPILTDWHPVVPNDWGEFPSSPFRRSVIYRGNVETWAYSHHQAVTKFRDKYVASWSNGLLHEDYPGQEVHYAWSTDGVKWSEPAVVAATPPESRVVRNNAGLYADGEKLYNYACVAKDDGTDVLPGRCARQNQPIQLDVYETSDLESWTHHENICPNVYLFEGPRRTTAGKLMCCGFELCDHHGRVLIWDDASRPADPPRVVEIAPSREGVMPQQGTWYQTEDGRIWMYQRDTRMSGYLALTLSDDGGETWSDLLRTNFPNTYSRAYAGRLSDGRYYIVGNNCDRFLDRRALQIALSDDGRMFDRQYTLVDGPTARRINGYHKENGYQYPNCYVDGDQLLVIYSVNKEDIEMGVVDVSRLE